MSKLRPTQSPTCRRLHAGLEPLELRMVLNAGPLVISELMASNNKTLADETGEFVDWLEIYNPTSEAVDLTGWHLTDDEDDLTGWTFPSVSIDPLGYLVVFASGKDIASPNSPLHTDFKLSSGGEYLALVRPDEIVSYEFSPNFPTQVEDVSFGPLQSFNSLLGNQGPWSYLVPSVEQSGLGSSWTQFGFDDTTWNKVFGAPDEGLGFSTRPVQFEVTRYKSNIEVTSLEIAKSVIADPELRLSVDSATTPVVNFVNTGPSGFFGGDLPFPGLSSHRNSDNFVLDVQAVVTIPTSGTWTFGVSSSDGFELELTNSVTTTRMRFSGVRDDGFNTVRINVPEPGEYELRLVYFEHTENSQVELFAAPGMFRTFEPDLFRLVGDRDSGGLATNELAGAVGTDVQDAMLDTNASIWTRYPFAINDLAQIDQLILQMQYNDGFVAYLNGVPVLQRNAPDILAWNSSATAPREKQGTSVSEQFDLSQYLPLLRESGNILSIQGLNVNASDGDFVLRPKLLSTRAGDALTAAVAYQTEPTPGEPNRPGVSQLAATPTVSSPGGTYLQASIEVELFTEIPAGVVRFTIDGTLPNNTSPVYDSPITINDTTVLKSRVFAPDYLASLTRTDSYLLLHESVADFSSDLPIVVLDNFSAGSVSANNRQPAYMAIFDRLEGRSALKNSPDLDTRAGFKTRGSSSLNRPKKSYSLEAWDEENEDRDIAPLGMPKESDWILYAPYNFDRALIRNPFVYELSNQVGRYAVRTRFVELFLNSDGGTLNSRDYQGVYVLEEKIKLGPNRVDVEKITRANTQLPEIAGGYILKIDRADPGDVGFLAGGQDLKWVSPKEENVNAQQAAWIKRYIDQFSRALNGPNFTDPELGYAKYIDVDSWIDHHLINEFTKNPDGLRLSTYMFKTRDGKLEMGPVWDFDRTLGPDDDNRAANPVGWSTSFNFGWWRRLFQDPNFMQRYIDRWYLMRQGAFSTENMFSLIDSMAEELGEAQQRNFSRWSGLVSSRGGWEAEIAQLKSWVQRRGKWIDSQFVTAPTFSHQGGSVEPGFRLGMTAPAGTLYFTTDGSDPRSITGNISRGAQIFDSKNEDLIPLNASWQYLDDGTNQGTLWRGVNFDDSQWKTGKGEFGFGDGGETTIITRGDSTRNFATTYFRKEFEIDDLSRLGVITLSLQRDDGAIVYINGQEFIRDNLPEGEVNYLSLANRRVGGSDESDFRLIQIPSSLLTSGTNVVAVEVHTSSASDNDLSFALQLFASIGEGVLIDSPTTVNARIRDGDQWSALVTATFDFNVPANSSNLAISEINYHPGSSTPVELGAGFSSVDGFEFIELLNTGPYPVQLDGVQFTDGIAFNFSTSSTKVLQPGEHLVVVGDTDAFALRYGEGILVAGEFFSGRLSNSGERLILVAADGETIADFSYGDKNPWPKGADGQGPSLELRQPGQNPEFAGNWWASSNIGGSPGGSPVTQADINRDGSVNLADFDLLKQFFGNSANFSSGDIDGNGRVDLVDFSIFQANFGAQASLLESLHANRNSRDREGAVDVILENFNSSN